MGELAQGEAQDQQQDAQVAHPGAPETQPVFAGEQDPFALDLISLGLGEPEPFEQGQGGGHGLARGVRRAGQGGGRVRLPLRAGDQGL